MPGLDVVVAHRYGVVAQVVHRGGDEVRRHAVYVVVVVGGGLALQEVARIQQQGLGRLAAHLLHDGREARHAARAGAVVEEVVGVDVAVDVGRVDDAQLVYAGLGTAGAASLGRGLSAPGEGAEEADEGEEATEDLDHSSYLMGLPGATSSAGVTRRSCPVV